MEDIVQKIEDLMEELAKLKDNENLNGSQIDDVMYELDVIADILNESIED